jgi:ribosomal protein S18 acetylase RimI-like enzyme
MSSEIKYKIKKSTETDIRLHLEECNKNFTPPLSDRINITEYSKKLFDKSITFEAWKNNKLTGLIGAYFNQTNQSAFITNVSVLKEFMGLGIASELLGQCIEYASQNNINEIQLEVNQNNNHAIDFYKKFNFIKENIKGEELIMKLLFSNNIPN